MDPLEQIMHHWSNRAQTPKKRWRTVCRNDAEGGLQAQKRQQQAPLRRWIRPSTWMTTPLDLDPDVSSLIVEALMRERDVATIQSFALVSRACAASVTTTLQTTRARLRQAATRVANAERGVHIWCGRAAREEARQEWLEQPGPPWPDDEENLEGRYMDHYNDDLSDREADEIDRMESLRDAFYEQMKRVGIPFDRRNALVRMAQVTWFHDNRSLLAHLSEGCEFCGSTTGVLCNALGGPVALFSCGTCRRKNGVELQLRPVGPMDSTYPPRPKRFVATVDACETEGNDYARALLCKHKARRKRMLTNRPHMLGVTNLMKRVHVIESNASLLACYDQSKWRMGYAPWEMVLWHRLPPTLPQEFIFSAMMAVRDSDLVRGEALRDAQRRKAVRMRGAYRRSALAKLFRQHAEERANVFSVLRKGTFEGWVQAIDLCSAAHAFEVRWMFRAEQAGLNTTDWRMSAYKLLDIEAGTLNAAVRRASAVAHAMRIVGGVGQAHDNNVGNVILQIVRNYPMSFLEGSVHCVNGLTSMLLHAPLELSVLKESNGLLTMQVEYVLGGPFFGRRLTVRSYFSGYTVSKILKALGHQKNNHGRGVTNEMVQEIARRANNTNFKGSERWNEARQVIFGLPAVWPEWITNEAAHAKWHVVHSLEYERKIRNK